MALQQVIRDYYTFMEQFVWNDPQHPRRQLADAAVQ